MNLNSWPPQKHQGQLATVDGCGTKTVQVRRIKLFLGVDCYSPKTIGVYFSTARKPSGGEGQITGHTLRAIVGGFLTRRRRHVGDLQMRPFV